MADPGFPVGGRAPVRGGMDLRCGHFSVKMYAKMKELCPGGAACAGHAPLDPPMAWSDGPIRILGIDNTSDLESVTDINYQALLTKVQNVLSMWSNRSLTTIVKILVVYTLAVSLMVYRMQVLPTPSKAIFKGFKDIVVKFLWDGKTSLIDT